MLRKSPTGNKKMANSIVLLLMFILYKTQVMYLVIGHDWKNHTNQLKNIYRPSSYKCKKWELNQHKRVCTVNVIITWREPKMWTSGWVSDFRQTAESLTVMWSEDCQMCDNGQQLLMWEESEEKSWRGGQKHKMNSPLRNECGHSHWKCTISY